MKLSDILTKTKNNYALDLFSAATIAFVEKQLYERGDKAYLRCQVRGKDVQAKPEEIVRQLWIHRLTAYAKYPLARLAVEVPITFGRDTSKRADLIVFDADRPTVPYIIIELKQPTAKGGKEQLKSYGHATGAPLACWSDGVRPSSGTARTRTTSSKYRSCHRPHRPSTT